MKFTYCSAEPLMGVGRILVFFASSFFFLSACAPVQPWERGRLAQAQMALDGDTLLSAMDELVYSSKEAASGGGGPAGGGCGCN